MVNLQSNTLENNYDRHLTLQQRRTAGPPDPDPPVRGVAGASSASPLSTQVCWSTRGDRADILVGDYGCPPPPATPYTWPVV